MVLKKQTRRLIGNVLVWGGLALITYTNLITFSSGHVMLPSDAGRNILAVAGVVIGLLWGLRG
jgi:uncharacterized membrane protein